MGLQMQTKALNWRATDTDNNQAVFFSKSKLSTHNGKSPFSAGSCYKLV